MRSHSEPPWTRKQLVLSLHQAAVETLIMTQVTNATPRYLAGIDPAEYTIEISGNGSLERAVQKVVSRPSQRRQFPSEESEHEIAELADEPISETSADDTASMLATEEMQSEASGTEAEPFMEETASLDESFLAADLDTTSPLTFQVGPSTSLSLSASFPCTNP
jgi:hypothetical protein